MVVIIVSTLMNEEYAEEVEIASFTDDDDASSHSSVAGDFTLLELLNEPNEPIIKTNMVQLDAY